MSAGGILPMGAPVHYTLAEVGAITRRSTRTLYRYIASGRLPASQPVPRGVWIVHRDDLEAFLERIRRGER